MHWTHSRWLCLNWALWAAWFVLDNKHLRVFPPLHLIPDVWERRKGHDPPGGSWWDEGTRLHRGEPPARPDAQLDPHYADKWNDRPGARWHFPPHRRVTTCNRAFLRISGWDHLNLFILNLQAAWCELSLTRSKIWDERVIRYVSWEMKKPERHAGHN